jgi:hypothetical protein
MRSLIFISILFYLFSCAVQERDHKKRPLFPVKEYGKWGFIDDTGVKVIPCRFDYVMPFSEGLAGIQVDSLWGFIDEAGEIVISPKYISTEPQFNPFFQDGLCHVELKTDSGVVNMFITKHDDVAFFSPYKYWEINSFKNGRALIEINEEICFIDKRGKIVIKTGFPNGAGFSEGIAHLWNSDSSIYIDTTGRVLTGISGIGHGDFHDGLAVMYNDPNYYIDKTWKRVFTTGRGSLVYHGFSDGMAEVYDRDLGTGFIDKTGKIVIPLKYSLVKEFHEGLSAVLVNDLWGFIDKKDNMVIRPQFDYLYTSFINGVCEVEKDDQKGYINRQGEYIWRERPAVQYEKIDLRQWQLDTLEMHRPLFEYFNVNFNAVRPGVFRYGNQLLLMLDTIDITAYGDKYLGYKLYLINQTKDTVEIPIREGRLKLVQQAVNPEGAWQDLDVLASFFCGNSFSKYSIPPAAYQIFAAPFFKGSYSTKFRFKLYLADTELYSNSYTGRMNPDQFVSEKIRNGNY